MPEGFPGPFTPPFYPIIYVRGYALTRAEIDATAADPFCGFNVGSTVFRATPGEATPPRKFIFESPVIRLATDFGYQDVYSDGYDIMDDDWRVNQENKMTPLSIVIYRYYDDASRLLGSGKQPSIQGFAAGLGELIVRVRTLVCENPVNAVSPEDFRCYLVAHSMGGLVCRAFLQNPDFDEHNARRCVDKLFTFATPHNGIDVAGLNIPPWLTGNELHTFSRKAMASYLNLEREFAQTGRVDFIPRQALPIERVFCLVGTNRSDYEVALGAARTFVGHGSDGLVRIENATLSSSETDGEKAVAAAKAFVYRSHSGTFGIVNSEEAYQNLTRFLFGDVRVDIWVDVSDITLPEEVRAQAGTRRIDALYQFEVLASPRGKLWYLTRRVAEEDSVACLAHQDWIKDPRKGSLYVSTLFLANRARVKKDRPTLAYSVSLGVRVPDYEVDRRLWINEHYEGGYLFRNSIVIEMTPPQNANDDWEVKYAWQDKGVKGASHPVSVKELMAGKVELKVSFASRTEPGIKGQLRFVATAWD